MIEIAVVDDHNMMRIPFCKDIDSVDGMRVILQAGNGQDLIEKLRLSAVTPDVCLLDINMPIKNGYETIEFLSKEFPSIKVVAMSMFDHEHAIVRMIKLGAKGFLLKSGDYKEAIECIKMVHTHGFYANGEISVNTIRRQIPDLTYNEIRFLDFCTKDLTYKEISQKMKMTERNIESIRYNLFEKLEVKTRIGLAMYAVNNGIIN